MAYLAPLHRARGPLHDAVAAALQECLASALPSAQPLHLAVLWAHLFHLLALTIILLTTMGGVNSSFPSIRPLIPPEVVPSLLL